MCTLTSARSPKKNVLGFSASEFSVSRIRCVSFGDFGPRKTYFLTNHLSLCGPKFPYRWFLVRVVLKRRRRKDGPNCGVCVSLFGIISKRRRERETSEERSGCKGHHRPQNHPNSEHTRSRERERERVVVFERRRFHPLDDRFSYFSKR